MQGSLLIVGGSVRAAVQSARRAGYCTYALDRFGDLDLLACGPALRLDEDPAAIPEMARQFPAAPVLYTGALENHPEVLEALARERTLLGNPASVVSRVRDPWELQRVLRTHGLDSPPLAPLTEIAAVSSAGWLVKPLRSGGGWGIRAVRPRSESRQSAERSGPATVAEEPGGAHYLQQRIEGTSISVSLIGTREGATWLGATRQLIGSPWAGARPFLYVGNIAPLPLAPPVYETLDRIGQVLVQEFGLLGLFGVDAILRDDQVWVLEVNPRYTAAMEVIERACPCTPIRDHVESFTGRPVRPLDPAPGSARRHGKAVVYSPRKLTITPRFLKWATRQNLGCPFPLVADLSAAGTTIPRGRPICTVFAEGGSEEDVEARLQARAADVYTLLA